MEYKIVISHSAEDLSKKVTELIGGGWESIGSHQVQIRHQQNRFRGQQHVDTLNDLEYTQTMIKNKTEVNENLVVVKNALLNLQKDAEMALNGEWDKSDDGFEAQQQIIEIALDKLNNLL